MQVAAPQGIKIYNVSAGKTLNEWILENRELAVKRRSHDPNRLELIQDFNFQTLATHVKVSPDGQYIVAAGLYPPLIRVFDVKDLSLKFERGLECEVAGIEILSEDYSKMIVARTDRIVEFHIKGGKLHQTRLPKTYRDMTFYAPSCDMLFASSSREVFRINLDQGRFLAPYETNRPAVACIKQNPVHKLLALCGDDGVVEFWDPRVRNSVASLNTGLEAVYSAAYDDDGLSLVLGGDSGHIQLYDIRSSLPVHTKQHQNELPITFVDFHNDGGLKRVASADSKTLKIWEKKTGKHFISIEPCADIKDVQLNKGTGLIFFAVDDPKIQSYYVPALGPAPNWCAFLDNLTEEMEEEKQAEYSDFKFVTRNELISLGLDRLIGSKYLKEYMHGFFMDMGLYSKVRSLLEPLNQDAQKKEKIHDSISAQTESRISARSRKKAAANGNSSTSDKISALISEAEPIAMNGKKAKAPAKKVDENTRFGDDELLDHFNPVDDSDEEGEGDDEEGDESDDDGGATMGELASTGKSPTPKKRKLQLFELKAGHAAPFTKAPKNRTATDTTQKKREQLTKTKQKTFTDRVGGPKQRRPFKSNKPS